MTAENVLPLVEKYWGGWRRGRYTVDDPRGAGAATKAVYAHVPWPAPTLPWVTVAFHGPAFSETGKDFAAVDTLMDLAFGRTSDLYQRLVEQEQKVDQLFPYFPDAGPVSATVLARVKKIEDA